MIDAELVRRQLKFSCDDDPETTYLDHLIAAAVDEFNSFTNRTLIASDQALPDPVGNAIKITKSIEHGALMLIAHWYSNRESVVVGVTGSELPMSTQSSWKRHRWSNF